MVLDDRQRTEALVDSLVVNPNLVALPNPPVVNLAPMKLLGV